jgi:quinol monooxygenase YgiN
MDEVVVVATMTAKDGRGGELEQGLKELVAASHGDDGCVAYALHRAAAGGDTFVMIERWRDQAALDAHFTQPHVQGLGKLAAELLASPPQILFTNPVPAGDPAKGVL